MTEAMLALFGTLLLGLFIFFVKEQKEINSHIILLTHLLFGRVTLNGLENTPRLPLLFQVEKIREDLDVMKERFDRLEKWYTNGGMEKKYEAPRKH